jgi:hypothetical protein
MSLDHNRGKSRRGRPQALSKFPVTKRSSSMNRRPVRKPGFPSNLHGTNTRTSHMGESKQQTGVGVEDVDQKESSSVTSSNCRVGMILSTGEEVVKHTHL